MVKVELDGVCFGYGDGRQVLKDIDLVFEEPGLYCILGPNGVGKSTVVRCISKILTPQKGSVRINGTDTRDMTYKDVSRTVTFVPSTYSDTFSMSVIDAVMLGRHGRHVRGSLEDDMREAYNAMRLLRIEKLADRKVSSLSAGQHQRVGIARGLVREPEVFMLDEPTSNLDVKYQVYVTELLRGIARQMGVIVIMICHDLNIAAKYADTVVMMSNPGRVFAVGTPDEVITPGNIADVYGIKARVIRDPDKGVPVVILGEAMMDSEWD